MTMEQQPERGSPYSEEEEDYVLLEHEESDENDEKEENSEDENEEEDDDVLEDDDEDLLQGSSNRRRSTAQCLVLLMASAYVLSLCAMLFPVSLVVVQEEEEEELPLSGPPRSWFLVLKPRVSGTILGTSKWFGDYYDDYTTDDNELSLTDPIRDKAIELAGVWMHREARTIFDTIANFQFHYDPDDNTENYHRDRVRFTQLHTRSGKHEYAFEFREVEANTIRRPFLRTLQHEVRVGGDTWACGDFGDVTIATRGMQAEWSRVFGDNVMRSLELRVSLADDDAYILDQDGKLIPEKPTQCSGKQTLHYNTANERLRMGWFYY